MLEVVRGHADWGPSEGVYAMSSREFLHGGDLYGGLVGSQPPWVYLFGALPLAIDDSLDALRFGCALLQVGTGLLVAEVVWRQTGHRVAAMLAVPLTMVTPWATHQHGLLLPEQIGAPLLLGAALLASRESTARWAGILAGLAVFAKVPFLLPAALIVAASPARLEAARWALGAVALQVAAFTAVFGTGLWRNIVTAQWQAGEGLQTEGGGFVQAGWNLFPLLVLAGAALVLRQRAKEPALLLTTAAGAVGALAMVITIIKPGTGLNVIVPSEPLLLALAVPGAVWLMQAEARARTRAVLATAALALLTLAQSASLLADPDNPRPFHRPGSSTPGWKVVIDRDTMDRYVAEARACPPGQPYGRHPLAAFIAGRRVPGDQPDSFIVTRAETHAGAFARVARDVPVCGVPGSPIR